MEVLAWSSPQAREHARRNDWGYGDRPVARAEWDRVRDHPIVGLAIYERPDDGDDDAE